MKFSAVNDSYIFSVNYLSCSGRNQQQAVSSRSKSVQHQSEFNSLISLLFSIEEPPFSSNHEQQHFDPSLNSSRDIISSNILSSPSVSIEGPFLKLIKHDLFEIS
ncbi:hypothetical protein NC652_032519 [Populus alba x Populus x berolinensis]|nr:hypothetical protein NC652_032519 [Populus alba x Populus x berolinensis]